VATARCKLIYTEHKLRHLCLSTSIHAKSKFLLLRDANSCGCRRLTTLTSQEESEVDVWDKEALALQETEHPVEVGWLAALKA
jgi:hypothetical protein